MEEKTKHEMEEKTKDQRHEEYLKRIPDYILMDDTFMNACFNEQPRLVETVLRIIMNKPGLTVKRSQIQRVFKNLHGRSVTLDIEATDENNMEYNIEFQNEDIGARPVRARYISSLIDANIIDPGEDFDKLPETYVIFVTKNDVLKMGKPVYTIERSVTGTDVMFNDRSHIVYVNGSIQDDTPLGRLMHDFHCKRAQDMYYRDIAERVSSLKDTEGGKKYMCKIMEEFVEQFVEQERIEMAVSLLQMNKLSFEEIAKASKLPVEKVRELAEEIKPETA